ncbi:hypothetical protein HYU96_03220 [Candidatus Daviesbacteria bacterium]|nr:hypothetical protein [Candidatus Daviesbacteria bacterium]
MKKLNPDTLRAILMFLIWKAVLVAVLIYSVSFIPLQYTDRFLGGGPVNYMLAPELFSWANFDGEHYLSIAIFGYKEKEHAFFPVYPGLISFLARPFSPDLLSFIVNSTIAGLVISNLSFLLALIFLMQLIKIDFPKKIAFLTLAILLVFPTSFYFGAVYSEGLFLLLTVGSFYLARKGRFLGASILGAAASATRVFGVLLLPALFIEAREQKAKFSKSFWIFLIPMGLVVYMLYQYFTTGDPLAFYNLQGQVGEQHQSGLILLPQVYFRYIKMLLTVDLGNPIYQTIILEFLVGIIFFLLPIYGYFKKARLSYVVFAMLGFLMPAITGSFSSVPRYVTILFPSFLFLAMLINKLPNLLKIAVLSFSALILMIETALFLRGYWIA